MRYSLSDANGLQLILLGSRRVYNVIIFIRTRTSEHELLNLIVYDIGTCTHSHARTRVYDYDVGGGSDKI